MSDSVILATVIGLWTVVITILWLVIGWRAMRAHEKLSDHHRQIAKMMTQISESIRGKNENR